jgi:Tfp pilus assembly protein PilO
MGWGRMLLLGNLGQQMDIQDQQDQIAELQDQLRGLRVQSSTPDLAARVDQLERELDEMRLYAAALIRYLAEKGVLDKAEFAGLVEAIDRADGSADAGYRGPMGAA